MLVIGEGFFILITFILIRLTYTSHVIHPNHMLQLKLDPIVGWFHPFSSSDASDIVGCFNSTIADNNKSIRVKIKQQLIKQIR